MSLVIDKDTSPESAKDAFNLVITEYKGIRSPLAVFRYGCFHGVALALSDLPNKDGVLDDLIHQAKNRLHAIENAKTKPKFAEAKQLFVDSLWDIRNCYTEK